MRAIRLLYLSAHQMSAYHWHSGELTGEGEFAPTVDGHQRFADYLGQHSSGVFTILANVTEEGFQVDTIPYLRGADRQAIIEGQNVTAAFHSVGFFPPLVIRMLRVGESTGALDTALINVGYFYNRDVKESVEKVQQLIEPMLTVVLGCLLGWIMLSVLGPVYDVISKIKT